VSFSDRHEPALDGFRGVAAMMILVHHGLRLPGDSALATVVSRLAIAGWAGVDMFFVLSGYLITGILCDAKSRRASYTRAFYMRRVLRLFPLYYAVLVVAALCSHWFAPGHAVPQLFLWMNLQNAWIAATGNWLPLGLNHLWSLAVEVQFYLVWPLIIRGCEGRSLAWVFLGLALIAPVARTVLLLLGCPWQAVYVLPLTHVDAFALGALLAWAMRDEPWREWMTRHTRAMLGLGGLAVVGLAAAERFSLYMDRFPTMSVGLSALAFLFVSLLATLLVQPTDGLWARAFGWRGLRLLGRVSYGLYVFHLPVLTVLMRWHAAGVPASSARWGLAPEVLLFLEMFAVTLALALVSWQFYERPCLRLKRYFS
jgi:peptidoglycan/LPS O-acetylase OafA/YrhL